MILIISRGKALSILRYPRGRKFPTPCLVTQNACFRRSTDGKYSRLIIYNDLIDRESQTEMKDVAAEEQTTSVVVGGQNEEQQPGSSSGSRPACFSSTVEECLFVLTTTMAIGQSSFFSGMVIVVTASIGRDLNMNSAEITWISAGITCVLYT